MKKSLLIMLLICISISCLVSCNECKHEYNEFVLQNANCLWDGEKEFTCQKCGDRYTETIPMIKEHRYFGEATCTTAKRCEVCDLIGEDPLGHNYNQDATCYTEKKCERCGKIDNQTIFHDYSNNDGMCAVCNFGVKFVFPKTPIIVNYQNISKCKIESIQTDRISNYSSSYYKITFLVESTYNKNGDSYSDYARFGWKIYDNETGMVVDSGTGYTEGQIAVGEKSLCTISYLEVGNDKKLQDGKTYRLEILNVN